MAEHASLRERFDQLVSYDERAAALDGQRAEAEAAVAQEAKKVGREAS